MPNTNTLDTGLFDKNGEPLHFGDHILYDDEDYMNMWVRGEVGIIIKKEDGKIAIRMKPFDEYTGSNQNIITKDGCDVILKISGDGKC